MPDNYYSEVNENGVVTPFRDLAAFPRSEQAVLGAKNIFDKNQIPEGADNNAVTTVLDTGLKISNQSASTHSSVRFNKIYVKPNTNYAISCNIETVSGKSGILVRGTNDGSTYTYLLNKVDESPTGKQRYIFNTGTSTQLRINLYCSVGTSETGEVNYKELMITLADDNDDTYAPYAMTNKELTDAVTLKDVTSDITRNTDQTAYSISSLFVYKIGRLVTVIGDIGSLTENAVPSGRSFITIATGLPKALKNSNIFAMPIGSGNQTQVYVEGNSSDMKMRGGTTGQSYQFVFTYISAS